MVRPMVMGEAAELGEFCYVASTGLLYKTDADSSEKSSGQIGMIVSGEMGNTAGTVEAGETVDFCWLGPVAGLSDLDETKTYYLSANPGEIADAAGTVTRQVGTPFSSTIFNIHPGDDPSSS